jgi:hypothetical protein
LIRFDDNQVGVLADGDRLVYISARAQGNSGSPARPEDLDVGSA